MSTFWPNKRELAGVFKAMRQAEAGLRASYADPARGHHGQGHIDWMLAELDRLRPLLRHPGAAELACWYHDAVYDPAARDNEARSEARMRGELGGVLDPALLDWAGALILATADHRVPEGAPPPLAGDCALFLDVDMAVLGAVPDAYDRYAAGVTHEFLPHHGEAAYRAGRAAFLRSALRRGPLFLTTEFAHLQAVAEANMRRELASLGG